MRKNLLSLLAIVAIAAWSCQDEKQFIGSETTPGEVVSLSLSPVLPANAGAKPLSSGDGGATELSDASYDLRYILEVYDGTTLVGTREVKTVDEYQTAAGVTFDVTLPAKQYQFVFWADFVTQGSQADLTYTTDNAGGLTDIEWKATSYAINDNLRDAYFATETVDLTAPVGATVTLRRPFGKLRILATDVQEYLDDNSSVTLGKAELTYTAPTTFPKGFNALTGAPGTETITLTAATCTPEYLTSVTVAGQTYNDVYLLAFDYFFVPSDLSTVSFEIELFDDADSPLASKTVTNAPVGANKLTTVRGGLFTKYTADLTVIIDDEFDPALASFTVSPNPLSLPPSGQIQLTINETPAGADGSFTFASNAPGVVTVDADGLVTAVSTGSATITVSGTGFSGAVTPVEVPVTVETTFANLDPTSAAAGATWTAVDKRDGKSYLVKKMPDGRIWMVQNLAFGDKCNETSWSTTPNASNSGQINSTGAYYGTCRTNTTAPAAGYYYNWQAAVNNANAYFGASDPYMGCSGTGTAASACQGICPEGWHVFTSAEFTALATAIGSDINATYALWTGTDDSNVYHWHAELDGNWSGSSFGDFGSVASLYTSTFIDIGNRKTENAHVATWGAEIDSWDNINYGRSVRCVRNYE